MHSGDLYVGCSQGTDMVFVSTAATDGHQLSIKAGAPLRDRARQALFGLFLRISTRH
ncbi:MAG: hypothetical protein NVSMB69_09630 [Novosphingobium sp.]